MDLIDAAGMDETSDTSADDECFDIHDDDDVNHDTADDTDDGGLGNLYTIKVPGGKVVYLNSALGLNLWPEQRIKAYY